MKVLLATLAFAGAFGFSVQAAGPAAPSDQELRRFVAASVQVHSIDQASQAEQQKAKNAEAASKLEDEAGVRMEKAVADNGFTTDRYTQIYGFMQSDPKVRSRVAALAKEQTK